jgi:hypothetical protein
MAVPVDVPLSFAALFPDGVRDVGVGGWQPETASNSIANAQTNDLMAGLLTAQA